MHILYIRPYGGEEAIVSAAIGTTHSVQFAEDMSELSDEEKAAVTCVSVFVDYELSAALLAQLPNLTLIATRSAGYDHVDMEYAAARGITVVRVPHYGTRTVAEFAIALMFALSRNAFRSYTDMLQKSSLTNLEAYEGFDLAGKTLGVVGTGAIGRSVCEIARGIGMHVVAYDVYPNTEFAETHGITYDTLEAVLGASDIVTVHVPSLPETYHLINAAAFAAMKPGSYLINTARGDIVDTSALINALESGHLAGAGLDVLEGEHALRDETELLAHGSLDADVWRTIVADHALIDMPNVIVTPHIAFNTKEAKREITDITMANIAAFVSGAPVNVVEP